MNVRNKKKLLEEIAVEDGHGDSFCFFKEIILHDSKYNERLITQVYAVNKFKWEESERKGEDIGWKEAWRLWVELGAARIFADEYNDRDSIHTIWTNIKNKIDRRTPKG